MLKKISEVLDLVPPYFLIIAACAIWALNIILLYPYTLNISPEDFNLLQYTLGTILILSWIFIRKVKVKKPKSFKEIGAVFFLGVIGSAVAGVCFVSGLQKISPSSFSFVQILQPFWVLFVAVVILKNKLAVSSFSILSWMLLNFVLIAWPDLHFGILLGDIEQYPSYMIMASIAMIIWGTSTLLGKYLLASFNIESIVFWRWTLSLIAAFVICILKKSSFDGVRELIDNHFIRFFLVSGVLDLFAITLYYKGLKKIKPVNAAVLELSYPAFGIIFSSLYTYNSLEPVQTLGIGALLLFMIMFGSQNVLTGRTKTS